MEYHRTKDILHVMKMLGHKQIRNTLKYIHLEAMLFSEVNDQYVSQVAHNVDEACKLVDVGFRIRHRRVQRRRQDLPKAQRLPG